MSKGLQTITVHAQLSPYGDALIFGNKPAYGYEPGLYLKQLLFAGHEASFYGTELAVQQTAAADVIVLPAEQVIDFWADPKLLEHIDWDFAGEAALLRLLSPYLSSCLKERKFHPSFASYRKGQLGWTWDAAALKAMTAGDAKARRAIRLLAEGRLWDAEENQGPELDEGNETTYDEAVYDKTAYNTEHDAGLDGELNGELSGADGAENGGADTLTGLTAAFSAAVFERYYSTETEIADLRGEFPALFGRNPALIAGMNEQAWLVAVGWKADAAPFRPILQLLEPEDAEDSWRLRLCLQDKLDASALYPVRLSGSGGADGDWPEGWGAHVRERSRTWLDRLRAGLPPALLGGTYVSEGGAAESKAANEANAGGTNAGMPDVLAGPLDNEAAWRFLKQDSEILLKAGWQVLLPAWWETASRRKPRLRARVRSGEEQGRQDGGPSLFGFDSLIDFDWRIAIGDADLTESEFNELIAMNERLVKFRGQWIALDPAFLAQIRRAMDSIDPQQGLSFQDVLQLHLLENKQENKHKDKGEEQASSKEDEAQDDGRVRIEVELTGQLVRLFSQLSRQEQPPLSPIPDSLHATLRAYQHEGFAWLTFLRRFGLGAILADDMGLGKTVQLIAYLLHAKESAAESGRPPAAPALIICPTSVLGNWQKELQRFAPSLRVLLHYGGARENGNDFAAVIREADVVLTSYATASLDQEQLRTVHWDAICLDEAQNIKNAQTKQSAAVRSLSARHRIALTGTPIENRLAELWSIYDFIAPGYLGSARAFQNRFAGPIEKDHDEQRTEDLKKLVGPFLLRRKKKDPNIQLDLPEKNEMKTYVKLTAEQAALYDQAVNQLISQMGALKGIRRKGAILSALTHLKQLCDHPLLVGGDPVPGLDYTPEDSTDYDSLVERSSKLERLLAMVRELREEDERCLIFTQYIGMGEMLRSVLEHELKEPVLYLNGSTSKTARDRMIESFQKGEGGGVFILSLKAGGVGLNLTAANHVFHFDRWWNPAVENQATDRAYRMGQTRDVQVHKFIALGTLEERIDEMLESKQQLSDNVISSSEGWITELSTEELRDLFTLRREWAG